MTWAKWILNSLVVQLMWRKFTTFSLPYFMKLRRMGRIIDSTKEVWCLLVDLGLVFFPFFFFSFFNFLNFHLFSFSFSFSFSGKTRFSLELRDQLISDVKLKKDDDLVAVLEDSLYLFTTFVNATSITAFDRDPTLRLVSWEYVLSTAFLQNRVTQLETKFKLNYMTIVGSATSLPIKLAILRKNGKESQRF